MASSLPAGSFLLHEKDLEIAERMIDRKKDILLIGLPHETHHLDIVVFVADALARRQFENRFVILVDYRNRHSDWRTRIDRAGINTQQWVFVPIEELIEHYPMQHEYLLCLRVGLDHAMDSDPVLLINASMYADSEVVESIMDDLVINFGYLVAWAHRSAVSHRALGGGEARYFISKFYTPKERCQNLVGLGWLTDELRYGVSLL